MSRTYKEGKRKRRPQVKHASKDVAAAVTMRHAYGSTEKILRRNRKTWTKLTNHRRRVLDKLETGSWCNGNTRALQA